MQWREFHYLQDSVREEANEISINFCIRGGEIIRWKRRRETNPDQS